MSQGLSITHSRDCITTWNTIVLYHISLKGLTVFVSLEKMSWIDRPLLLFSVAETVGVKINTLSKKKWIVAIATTA